MSERTYVVEVECRWCASRVHVRFAEADLVPPEKLGGIMAGAVGGIAHDEKLCVGGITERNDQLIGELFSR